jgi:hypothetical protein
MHDLLGKVLARRARLLLLGRHEPSHPRNVAAPLYCVDWHRLAPPRPVLVPLQDGVPADVVSVRSTCVGQNHTSRAIPAVCPRC